MRTPAGTLILSLLLAIGCSTNPLERELRTGHAFHAFDHLGAIGEQADAAADSGVNIIYATGLGGFGYGGLPSPEVLAAKRRETAAYNQHARDRGIRVIIGYVCATSMVRLDSFATNWSADLRRQFASPPTEWRQQGRDGKPLPSWYGGDYQPACMNHPDWQAYEKHIVKEQLLSGHDGIFFDNPTVHPRGCYCAFCMEKFARFLRDAGVEVTDASPEALRQLADRNPTEFLRFRATIARDFLAEIRLYARTLKRDALITCNNSLNSPGVLFSQSRTYAYNIQELSKAEDFVVVEDQGTQPRRLPDGRVCEYGPTYRQFAAISHGKPVVAVTIADADYHTPPDLVRLAMAEAAAHGASYLAWPTWPAEQRARMSAAIRPQAEFLRQSEALFQVAQPRADLLLFLPAQRWTKTNRCVASELAAVLTQRNIQYRVVIEDDLASALATATSSRHHQPPALLVESAAVLDDAQRQTIARFQARGGKVIYADESGWSDAIAALPASVTCPNHPYLRAVVHDEPHRTTVHLYNLDILKLSSFEDRVQPTTDVALQVRTPLRGIRSVHALTADREASSGELSFTTEPAQGSTLVTVRVPKVQINTVLSISD